MNIRFAAPSDGARLRRIYAQYIDTPVTFECSLPGSDAFSERIQRISAAYSFLVCENQDGTAAGYAYAHRQMEREAYQWNAELSVYLDADCTARGLGTRLYRALFAMLRLQGVKTVYGAVTVPNPASERLHTACGFTKLGTYHSTGYKCGKWHDVAWFEKSIAPCAGPPQPVLPIHAVPQAQLAAILENA